MRYKKFFLIPILIFVYIFFIVDVLINYNPAISLQTTTTIPSAGGQQIGIGESISVTVTRPYFFGLFRLPVYTNNIGYIGDYHQWFFYFIGILTVVFIIMEFKHIGMKQSGRKQIERGERKMAKKSWVKDLAKVLGYGIIFGFVVYLLSGDAGVSVGLGLLLMYLEYKLK